jgi:hypothetical protein
VRSRAGIAGTSRMSDLQENVIADARACTRVPPVNFHGKEGVDGSSPSEGSLWKTKPLQMATFCCRG